MGLEKQQFNSESDIHEDRKDDWVSFPIHKLTVSHLI